MIPRRRGYKMRTIDITGDGDLCRVKVVRHRGFEGYIARWVDSCSGCCELGDYGSNPNHHPVDPKHNCHIGSGCEECGYTGKRRNEVFIAFDPVAYDAWFDRIYERYQRIRASRERAVLAQTAAIKGAE